MHDDQHINYGDEYATGVEVEQQLVAIRRECGNEDKTKRTG